MQRLRLSVAILVAGLLAATCTPAPSEIVPEPYRPTDEWDAYRHGLEVADLAGTALGEDWLDAADAALESPVVVELPYQEHGVFDPAVPRAEGYRFAVRRGQRVRVRVQLQDEARPTRLFLDLFRLPEDEEERRAHVATAPAGERRLAFEPRQDGHYVLTLQPELLRGGRFDLAISLEASLEFPVEGADMTSVWSAFGVPRDGGRRSHHGVDIFAPRGTPVVAATRALVREVEVRERGGKVIWLHDPERGLHLYYAHLDAQDVEEGTWVEQGQAIGRVGNTGNAITTPPHLHFGIYARGAGPIDPDPFLRPASGALARLTVSPESAGGWAVTGAATVVRRGKAGDEEVVRELQPGSRLRIWAATGSHYRVSLDDGTGGFVPSDLLAVPPDF